jgi:magnesium transporter
MRAARRRPDGFPLSSPARRRSRRPEDSTVTPRPAEPRALPRQYARVCRRLLHAGARDELGRVLDRMHPAEAIELLKELSASERRAFIAVLTGHPAAAAVFADLPQPLRADVLAHASDEGIAALVARQPPDEAADLLGLLPPERSDTILRLLDEKTAANLDRLMTYGRDTAGGMMTTRYVALPGATMVGEAIARLRAEPEAETVFYVYVVDEAGRLEGVVSLRQLVLARPDQEMHAIMNPRVISVRTDEPRARVADLIARYNILALPVVGEGQRLLGIVTVDDAIDAIADETTRELYQMAGLDTDDRVTTPASVSIRRRLPWMTINLGTAILAATVVSLFEGTIGQVVALATFMPIVAGMGGNGATQTLTVIVRAIALGDLDFSTARRAILREALVGVSIGVATGAMMAFVALLWKGNWVMGVVIGAALIFNLLIGGLAGAIVPIVLKWLKIDPALGSSVIVTTFTDCFGFLSFLGLATLLIRHLGV